LLLRTLVQAMTKPEPEVALEDPVAPIAGRQPMLFSFAVRSVYMESCSMYVRGGVYVVVHDSMGPVMAKLSVSALVFDYILTGPISVVSAGQYVGALLNEISRPSGPGCLSAHSMYMRYAWARSLASRTNAALPRALTFLCQDLGRN
jgi:hypothetical protein